MHNPNLYGVAQLAPQPQPHCLCQPGQKMREQEEMLHHCTSYQVGTAEADYAPCCHLLVAWLSQDAADPVLALSLPGSMDTVLCADKCLHMLRSPLQSTQIRSTVPIFPFHVCIYTLN